MKDMRGVGILQTCGIVLIDGDEPYREGLRAQLRSRGCKVVGDYSTVRAARLGIRCGEPLLALLEPAPEGGRPVRELREVFPDLRTIVLSADTGASAFGACMGAGAWGYIGKAACEQRIIRCIEDVAEGAPAFSPDMRHHLMGAFREDDTGSSADDLTTREREVIGLIAEGYSYAGAARTLEISLGTVQSHVKNIYRKLGVSSKAQAASVVVRAGLLSPAAGYGHR